MADTGSDLAHLLLHWVEHNEAHLETHRLWARQACSVGLDEAAQPLNGAVRAVDGANDALKRAARSLPDEAK